MFRHRFPFPTLLLTVGVILASCQRSTEAAHRTEEPSPEATQTSTATSGTRPSASQAVAKAGSAIVAFGDSLTAGVAGRSYPEYLQDLLDSHHQIYRVENQGVSGDTTTDGLARIDNVIDAHPALVILEFGGNDGLRGIPVESTRNNLEAMISKLKAARLPLVLLGITLPPNYGPEYVKPFTAMFPELAKKYRIPLLPFLLQGVYRNPALMQPDGIHPNGDGNRIVADDVYRLITPVLKPAAKG